MYTSPSKGVEYDSAPWTAPTSLVSLSLSLFVCVCECVCVCLLSWFFFKILSIYCRLYVQVGKGGKNPVFSSHKYALFTRCAPNPVNYFSVWDGVSKLSGLNLFCCMKFGWVFVINFFRCSILINACMQFWYFLFLLCNNRNHYVCVLKCFQK